MTLQRKLIVAGAVVAICALVAGAIKFPEFAQFFLSLIGMAKT
jgi:hypothetical protein